MSRFLLLRLFSLGSILACVSKKPTVNKEKVQKLVKKATEDVPENQVIKVEIKGVKMEFSLKPGP